MRAEELTVEVKAKLTVSDETALRCARILNIWQEDNPDKYILRQKRNCNNPNKGCQVNAE